MLSFHHSCIPLSDRVPDMRWTSNKYLLNKGMNDFINLSWVRPEKKSSSWSNSFHSMFRIIMLNCDFAQEFDFFFFTVLKEMHFLFLSPNSDGHTEANCFINICGWKSLPSRTPTISILPYFTLATP